MTPYIVKATSRVRLAALCRARPLVVLVYMVHNPLPGRR
jgi:hypothetical protein